MKLHNKDFARVLAGMDINSLVRLAGQDTPATSEQKARHLLARRANDALKGTRPLASRLHALSDREAIIDWMVCNDGNGALRTMIWSQRGGTL